MLLIAVAAVRISSRSGLPSLLLYLGIGVAIGQDGIGNVAFDNAELTQVIGYAALVVILAEGGLGTKWKEIKPALPAAVVLSTVGVAVSVGITATAAHYLVGLDWRQALIIGAVVSSTDAAAVFSVLRKVPLPSRVTGVLEAESGFNDAPVVILVVAFSTAGPVDAWYVLVGTIALELAIGVAVGLAVGFLGAYGLRHVALPASGLYPIAVMAIAVVAYAAKRPGPRLRIPRRLPGRDGPRQRQAAARARPTAASPRGSAGSPRSACSSCSACSSPRTNSSTTSGPPSSSASS